MPSSSSSDSATESDSNPDIECSSQESDESLEELSDGGSSPIPRPFLQLFYFVTVWQVAFRVSTSAICALFKFLKFFCLQLPASKDSVKCYATDQGYTNEDLSHG